MARKTRAGRGIKTGFNAAKRLLSHKGGKKLSHRQKWTRISITEFTIAAIMCVISLAVGSVAQLIIGLMIALAGFAGLVESRSTPPASRHTVHKPERDKLGYKPGRGGHDARVPHGTIRVTPWDGLKARIHGGYGGDRPRPLHGRRPCGAACQYSRKPAETCNCSCGGTMHGMKAPAPTAAKKRTAKKQPAGKKTAARRTSTKKRKPRG